MTARIIQIIIVEKVSMIFDKIFIEEDIKSHPKVHDILKKVSGDRFYIDNYDEYWGRSKKPYLHKRTNLNLYLAQKKGQLVKETPPAYGTLTGKHYYFIHSYNCIYECDYCYLQGHFHTPDLVLFVNHNQIIEEMQRIVDNFPNEEIWFHAGEFSDSLALSHITSEWDEYWKFFEENPNAKLELRTKSVNIKSISNLPALNNIIVSFSLGSSDQVKGHDLKTPSLKARIKAMEKLEEQGKRLGFHLDPIIYEDNIFTKYENMLDQLFRNIRPESIAYVSLGVVRFTSDVYKHVKNNYPDSPIHQGEMVKSFDGKVRYSRPMRLWILNNIKSLLLSHGLQETQIYLCMEE